MEKKNGFSEFFIMGDLEIELSNFHLKLQARGLCTLLRLGYYEKNICGFLFIYLLFIFYFVEVRETLGINLGRGVQKWVVGVGDETPRCCPFQLALGS